MDPNNAAADGLDDFSDALKGVDNTPKPVSETVWEDLGITDEPKKENTSVELDDLGITDEEYEAAVTASELDDRCVTIVVQGRRVCAM